VESPGRILSIFSVILVVFSAFALTSNASSAEDEPVIVTTDKGTYSPGETVKINVSLVVPLFASFSSSCQCYFVVEDLSGNTVYDLRSHSYWAQVLTFLHGPKSFGFTWNQKDDAGGQVPEGTYNISGFIAGYHPMDDPVAGGWTFIAIDEEPTATMATSYSVTLRQGWNMFSLPLVSSNYTSANLGLPTGGAVVPWDSATQSYGQAFIVGITPPSFAFPIVEGKGYWIWVPVSLTLTLFGDVLTTKHQYEWIVPPGGGWVFVGFPETNGSAVIHASDVVSLSPLPGGVLQVVWFDPVTQTYRIYIAGLPTTNFHIVPGQAYWVYISQSMIVEYGP